MNKAKAKAQAIRAATLAQPAEVTANIVDMRARLADMDRQYRHAMRAAHEAGGGGRGSGSSGAWSDPTGNVALDDRKANQRRALVSAAVALNVAAIEIRRASAFIGLCDPPEPPNGRLPRHVELSYAAKIRRMQRGEE